MPTPLPNLQFAVLSLLGDESLSGERLRLELRAVGLKTSPPDFDRLMSALENAGLVSGEGESEAPLEHQVRERSYSVTDTGRKERDQTAGFHQRMIGLFRGTNSHG